MSTPQNGPRTPEAIHTVLEAAFNHGDLDTLVGAYDEDATLVVPTDGRTVHGRDEIREATAPLLALSALRMRSVVTRMLRTDGVALAQARWEFSAIAPDGSPVRMAGHANLVSRRRPDGSWGIVLDDPMSRA